MGLMERSGELQYAMVCLIVKVAQLGKRNKSVAHGWVNNKSGEMGGYFACAAAISLNCLSSLSMIDSS